MENIFEELKKEPLRDVFDYLQGEIKQCLLNNEFEVEGCFAMDNTWEIVVRGIPLRIQIDRNYMVISDSIFTSTLVPYLEKEEREIIIKNILSGGISIAIIEKKRLLKTVETELRSLEELYKKSKE